ncbi:MAG: sterol desaturase family protein [Rhodospirillales bacterium]|nr:sterol desaturase family protein [Rhodospirillales bacterium]
MDFLVSLFDRETGIGGPLFYGAILVVVLWEAARPRRAPVSSTTTRWINNIALAGFDFLLSRWTIGFVILQAAVVAARDGWGLLNLVELPWWFALGIGFLWADLVSYAIHRLYHSNAVLWRIHRVHHSDPDIDFTTSHRHHPFEMLVTIPLTALAVIAMGTPPLALLMWWAVTGLTSVVQHGNVGLSGRLDHVVRQFIITPAMHLVHHSSHQPETDSNYGQLFPWWDRALGTYCHAPEGGYEAMTLGLNEFRAPRDQLFDRLMVQPFVTGQVHDSGGKTSQQSPSSTTP